MGIVVITIPGDAKKSFVNSLHKRTNNGVDLVIIQKKHPDHYSLLNRFKRLYKSVGFWGIPREVFYAIRLRADKRAKQVLEYFRERSGANDSPNRDFIPKILETYSVNSDEVHKVLKKLSPNLLVIWGSTIIKPHIIDTARRSINLHMGLCPYYRGAIANQHAVMNSHINRIGATIHYAEKLVDSGNILETITIEEDNAPKILFRRLNDRAEKRFVDIAARIHEGEDMPGKPQDITESENLLLREWIPSIRYKLAQKLIKWEDIGLLEAPINIRSLQNLDYSL